MAIIVITATNGGATTVITAIILVYFIINFDFITFTFNYFSDFNSWEHFIKNQVQWITYGYHFLTKLNFYIIFFFFKIFNIMIILPNPGKLSASQLDSVPPILKLLDF